MLQDSLNNSFQGKTNICNNYLQQLFNLINQICYKKLKVQQLYQVQYSMIIQQKTVQHRYKSEDPWFGTKKCSFQQQNQKPCQKTCCYKDGQLIKSKQSGSITVSNPPNQTIAKYKGQVGYADTKVAGQYQNTKKYQQNSRLKMSGTGEMIQTLHYVDQSCPQKKKKQNNDKSKQKEQGQGKILALGLVAVGGYVGSYYILKKSFQEESKRPKNEQEKAIGNILVQTTVTTGGMVGGGIYGASIGAVAGPVGAIIGAGIGMLGGSALGYGLKKIMPWNW